MSLTDFGYVCNSAIFPGYLLPCVCWFCFCFLVLWCTIALHCAYLWQDLGYNTLSTCNSSSTVYQQFSFNCRHYITPESWLVWPHIRLVPPVAHISEFDCNQRANFGRLFIYSPTFRKCLQSPYASTKPLLSLPISLHNPKAHHSRGSDTHPRRGLYVLLCCIRYPGLCFPSNWGQEAEDNYIVSYLPRNNISTRI